MFNLDRASKGVEGLTNAIFNTAFGWREEVRVEISLLVVQTP
jgi:hypothetical protein